MTKLTEKQKAFVREYLIDLNATQAAIRAGYSKKTAQQTGSENLLKPVIQKTIQKAIDKRARKTDITAERVLNEIAQIAFSDDDDLRPNDKLKGLEMLGRHLVLFTDKQLHGGEVITRIENVIVNTED